MPLYFITGNKGKFAEVAAIISGIEQLDIDLPEIQSINTRDVIAAKLVSARAHHAGEYIVEDTSVYLECFDYKLPGPLIKSFFEALGGEGLAALAHKLGLARAEVRCLIGHRGSSGETNFFEGVIAGTICAPRGNSGFGWDHIFIPDGYTKTFAEMTQEEKNTISHRRLAVEKLKAFLLGQ